MTDTQTTASGPDAVLIASGVEGGVRDQVRAWWDRVRGGEMGALPASAGIVVLTVLFTFLSPFFLTERNFANLLTQAATLVMLAMALTFVLLLGEIDLSAGVTSGMTMALFVVLDNVFAVAWPIALLAAFGAGLATGLFIGFFVARVGIPSFVVTLGLFLGFQGLALTIIGDGGLYRLQVREILAIQNSNMPVWGGWLMLVVILGVVAATSVLDRRRRTRAGVPNRTVTLVWVKLAVVLVVGGAVVAVLSQNRSASPAAIVAGVPVVVPIVLTILWLGTFLLDRTRFGRYVYSVGGNAEAARRAGINVRMIRWSGFVLCSTLAVVSGLLSISKVGSVDAAAGREIVLSGVAAAVVGGVSLFGGRGRLLHAAVGALVIAIITNGLGLLNLPAGVNFMVTGSVLVLAATVDAVSRSRASGTVRRN
ncbi:D-xylose transport system permease protein [Isoptericola sp. CG 20/1183]|uniref:Xylose transport system permease protein XylH n=1 Tax=Isoptericola halotolerans TaxID=300560 RepID=A0ABX5EEM9_9MICO|nr:MULTISPECIES: ABC transporter permease [Isoptericola]MCK0118480.1 ABC transporter permease [Isoptericola sp. S6320L]PRZ07607.1 D-xylose transport system permease protein [Isoptericola halotolerans]PRZ08034.1 D-xylose transport system permease protein [Isoptericola sp. CG 20/1183]